MNRLEPLLRPILDPLARLAPRERALVLTAGIVVLVTLLFLLVWEPIAQARQQRAMQLESARALANRLEVIGAEVRAISGNRPAVNRSISLLAAVDQAARSGTLGRAPSRLQPEGEREVRVWLDATPYDNLVRWIDELETRHGIVVATLDVERGNAPGTVNARLTLIRP